MMIFGYTFLIVFFAMVFILGVGSFLKDDRKEPEDPRLGEATASMCTTRLLGKSKTALDYSEEDFVIEQDLVYTYDSFNL